MFQTHTCDYRHTDREKEGGSSLRGGRRDIISSGSGGGGSSGGQCSSVSRVGTGVWCCSGEEVLDGRCAYVVVDPHQDAIPGRVKGDGPNGTSDFVIVPEFFHLQSCSDVVYKHYTISARSLQHQ